MEMIRNKTNIDFIGIRNYTFAFSGTLILISILSFIFQGLNFGIDFAGGTLIQLRFPGPTKMEEIRAHAAALNLGELVIQEFGSSEEVIIRVERQMEGEKVQSELVAKLTQALQPLAGTGKIEVRRVEYVGPQVGKELTWKGLLAVFYSLFAILAYVGWRFEFRFALGAVIALFHDVIITVGYFSLFHKEFTLVVVAAVLTVIGYSINDTIVIFDRIREEMKRLRKQPLPVIINAAVNETLSRTLITSLTVVLVLISLLLVGGEVIRDFSVALFIGVVFGTYSSIFVASPIVILLEKRASSQTPVVEAGHG
ncbi:MAG: protein translocase subunit SecF [Magnetococcales bacterium]|nr:protein translocase subunit SecF [Magnetococcales bacterium]